MSKNPLFFLEHIKESIENIESFSKGLTIEELKRNKLKQSAIIRQIEIIGEAVKNLPIDFTVKYPHIEWSKIAGARDKLIHDYFGIDYNIVWEIVIKRVPSLKKDVNEILKEMKHNESEIGIKNTSQKQRQRNKK